MSAAHAPGSTPPPATTRRRWWRFFAIAAVLVVLLTLAWKPVSGHLSSPSAALAQWTLNLAFDGSWLYRARHTQAHTLELDTRLRVTSVRGPDGRLYAVPPGRQAEMAVEVDPARYGYSLPILLALLLAARTARLLRQMLLGALILLPFQAFSTVMLALKEVVFSPGAIPQLGYASWQLELIAFAYQFGVLVVPTIAPIVLWLALDSRVRGEWAALFPAAQHAKPA